MIVGVGVRADERRWMTELEDVGWCEWRRVQNRVVTADRAMMEDN